MGFPVMVGEISVPEEGMKPGHLPEDIKYAKSGLIEWIPRCPAVELDMQKAKPPSGTSQVLK